MESNVATVAAAVSVASAFVAGALGIWTALQARRAEQIESYRAIHDLYDKMVEYKFENPSFLVRARDWHRGRMSSVYDESDPEHIEWSQYYTFAELCVGFANAVLQARSRGLIGDKEFDRQWERLVRLVVAEHYPIISEFVDEGPYVSEYLREYLVTTERDRNWNWTRQHERLSWVEESD
ncbi:MAG: hypothetical protein Kow0056_04820 [Coriobacteriia bacterium]